MPAATVDEAIDRALAAYAQLTERAEEIEDEWSYVNDLSTAWRDRLELAAGSGRARRWTPPSTRPSTA